MGSETRARILVVSGTDTGVGKTVVCGLLLAFLRRMGAACGYQKWAATGGEAPADDLVRVCELSGMDMEKDATRLRVDYLFELAASPHLAAETEGKKIDPDRLIASTLEMAAGLDWLIVEGAGGLMVPLNRETLIIDLIARLDVPVLLAARSGLGTINHTLLSIQALKARNIPCAGIVFCDEGPELDERIVADNQHTVAAFSGAPVLGRLPRRNTADLHRDFSPIGEYFSTLRF